uniref:Uncharacterized protein n=1 Tax=Anguilla anguilla TaxID=7936 RepID=A0A0E9RVD6_ANGAN
MMNLASVEGSSVISA